MTTMTRAGTATPVAYNRISRFRVSRGGVEADYSRGVDRQAADADTAARDLDLGPVLHFTDDGESASAFRKKERTNWPEFLAYLASGEATHALLWNVDRATRTTEAGDEFLAACRAGGVLIVQTATMQVADPFNIHDVHNLKQAALQAEYEVAKMSMRQLRAKKESRTMGTPHGGRRRFGYEPGMREIRESEATVLRDVVRRFLAGESLRSLAAWLNTEGIPTPSTEYRVAAGKAPAEWTGPNLRHLIGGPHLAGLRVHGRASNGVYEVVGTGTWPAILEPETHRHVVAMLAKPERRANKSTNTRVYLLSSLATCAACGESCRVAVGKDRAPSYTCRTGRHVHRRVDLVDAVVESAVVKRLARYDGAGLLVDDTATAELVRLRDARQAVTDLLADYAAAAATMRPEAYANATNGLHDEAARLDTEIQASEAEVHKASRVLDGAVGPEAATAWATFDLSRRRAIIAELCTVELVGGPRTTPAGTVFDPEDVVIRWA